MIPTEVAEIADLIAPGWGDMDDDASTQVIAAAYRIHANYCRRLDASAA